MALLETFERDYYEFLRDDMLEQFKDGDTLVADALLRTLAEQHEQLLTAFKELVTRTNVDDAYGVQLDGCGDIVKLTRAQAGMLSNRVTTDADSILEDPEIMGQIAAGQITTPTQLLEAHAQNGIIPFIVIDDGLYREYIRYKIFLNSNHCTYRDLMKALGMFWTRGKIAYVEDVCLEDGVDRHATILLRTPELPNDGSARLFFLIPIIKAAGVELLREATTFVEMEPDTVRAKPIITSTAARVSMAPVTINNI